MATITRSRRAEIRREAATIRRRGQHRGWNTPRTLTAIRSALPEVTVLEGWRLALGWSRAQTISRIAALYRADGLQPPGLSESMLCRWEHAGGLERPGDEYTVMLCRAYGAHPEQLGLARTDETTGIPCPPPLLIRYGHPHQAEPYEWVEPTMTTVAGLPAVRESLRLSLLADPTGSPTVFELAEAAVEHYAHHYSKHPPQILFDEVHATRGLLAEPLAAANRTDSAATHELRRSVGYLSALMGNLAFHLEDFAGARAHLATAHTYGHRIGDMRLTAWTCGARSMVALADNQPTAALEHAKEGLALAPAGLSRAQLHAWAQLRALARQGREREADEALAAANRELDADPAGQAPGRFGFDEAERALHEAEAHLALGRGSQAAARAERSQQATVHGTPGWAAATLTLARAEACTEPGDATARALGVLDHVPAARLRSTARQRLTKLDADLSLASATGVAELHERVCALPAAIDPYGTATA